MLNVEFTPKGDGTENPLGILLNYDRLSTVTTEVLSDQYQLTNNERFEVTALFTHADGIEFVRQDATNRNEYTLIDANGIKIPGGQTITFHTRVQPDRLNSVIAEGSGKTVLTANISISGEAPVVKPPPRKPDAPIPTIPDDEVSTTYYFTVNPTNIEFSDTVTEKTVEVLLHKVVRTDTWSLNAANRLVKNTGSPVDTLVNWNEFKPEGFEIQLNGISGLTTSGFYNRSGKPVFDLDYLGGALAAGADMDVLVDTRVYPGAESSEIGLTYEAPEQKLVIDSTYFFTAPDFRTTETNVLKEYGSGLFTILGNVNSTVSWTVNKSNLPSEYQAIIVGPEKMSVTPPSVALRMRKNDSIPSDLTSTIKLTATDGDRTATVDVPVVFVAPEVTATTTTTKPPGGRSGGGGSGRFGEGDDDDLDERDARAE